VLFGDRREGAFEIAVRHLSPNNSVMTVVL
jgi:hypothetical protein